MSDFLDISELRNIAEELPAEIVTSDYSEFEIMPVGEYTSPSRQIKVRGNEDGTFTLELTYNTGFYDASGRTYAANLKYPMKSWASSKLFERANRPGKTSQLAEYLERVGLGAKGLTGSDLVAAVEASQDLPVTVFIGRRAKQKKEEKSGKWFSPKTKTKDFLVSGDPRTGDAVYASSIQIDGETWNAEAFVQGFGFGNRAS